VVAPPADQEASERIGVLYFVRPEDDVELIPVDSPFLNRIGFKSEQTLTADGAPLKAGEWVRARVAHNYETTKSAEKGIAREGKVEDEILKGVKTKYYA
jgi:hypothetical protein